MISHLVYPRPLMYFQFITFKPEKYGCHSADDILTIMSPNGNIFRVTSPFWGESTGSPVDSPHKGQWRRALMFSLIFAWINGWANKRDLVIWDAIAIIMTSLLRLNVFYLMVFSFGCQWSLFSRVGLGWASLLVLSLFWFGQCVCTARQASTFAWANAGPVSMSLYGISVLIDMVSTTSSLCSSRSYHEFFKWWLLCVCIIFCFFS